MYLNKPIANVQVASTLFYDELVNQCKQGSPAGYKALYNQYAKAMYNTSLRIVNNAADAEDIVQEAFIDAFRNLGRFSYQSTFGAWMKRIVINKSINHLRRKRQALLDLNSVPDEGWTEEAAPDDADLTFRVDAVRRAVQRLPDGYRTILTLHLFEEYDYETIADMLSISPVTARTQYHRAKKLLLTLLKQHV